MGWFKKSEESVAKMKDKRLKRLAFLQLELSDVAGTMCISPDGRPFIFREVFYDEEKDKILFVMKFSDNLPGKISTLIDGDSYFDYVELLKEARQKWIRFRNELKILNVEMKIIEQ